MELKEISVTKKTVYDGIIVRVRQDKARLIDDSIVDREVVEHPGGVAIIAIDENQEVVMVKQFRYPVGDAVLELPAGKLEPGEDPAVCAARELEEETGIRAEEMRYLGCSYSSPGIFAEKIHLYLARKLQQGEAHPEEGEFLEVLRIPLEKLLNMVSENRIMDAKTMVGLLKASLLLQNEALL